VWDSWTEAAWWMGFGISTGKGMEWRGRRRGKGGYCVVGHA
jgi:hypothetical protein